MTKSFNSYIDFFYDLKGQDLSAFPALLFYFNATGNSLGCHCTDPKDRAIKQYKNLISTLSPEEKAWLKQRYNTTALALKQDREIFIIDL